MQEWELDSTDLQVCLQVVVFILLRKIWLMHWKENTYVMF